MPSGTLEIEKLMKQIEEDLTSNEDESESATDEPEALENSYLCLALQMRENNLGLCMAMTMTEELPRSWKQAVNVHHWKEAMEKEINELKAKRAWVLVDRTVGMKVLPGYGTTVPKEMRMERLRSIRHGGVLTGPVISSRGHPKQFTHQFQKPPR